METVIDNLYSCITESFRRVPELKKGRNSLKYDIITIFVSDDAVENALSEDFVFSDVNNIKDILSDYQGEIDERSFDLMQCCLDGTVQTIRKALRPCVSHRLTKGAILNEIEKNIAKFDDGGMGFDYRLAMGIPDYWIKMIKEKKDEDWGAFDIFWKLTDRRKDEKTISYAESHDQALVGDKTIIFRLIDSDMYWHFKKGDENDAVHRGIALHKMIRLVTASTMNGGYLNFMGNEFGHPEWIDFPREGNGWSHKYARRQWNLVDNKELCYHYLGDFDRAMLNVIKSEKNFNKTPVQEIWHNDGDQVLAFSRGDLIFVFNFSPNRSYTDYGFLVPTGSYSVVLNTDAKEFGGNGLSDDTLTHLTTYDGLYVKDKKEWLKLYIPARSAVVLRKN